MANQLPPGDIGLYQDYISKYNNFYPSPINPWNDNPVPVHNPVIPNKIIPTTFIDDIKNMQDDIDEMKRMLTEIYKFLKLVENDIK